MADSTISSPFPDIGLAFVDAQGRISRVWYEFLLRQFRRTGGTAGGDLGALTREVAEIEKHLTTIDGEIGDLHLLVESSPMAATFIAVLGRLASLEMLVASQPAAAVMQRVAVQLPDPVAPLTRAAQVLPDPVASASRPANDDLRKLIEAQT